MQITLNNLWLSLLFPTEKACLRVQRPEAVGNDVLRVHLAIQFANSP